MGILQAAFPVVLRADAEVFLVQAIPNLWKFGNGKLSADQLLFDFITHHHVQGVGQLIGLRADQRRLRVVDFPIELLFRYSRELLRKDLPAGFQKRTGKRSAPADDILIKAALALMDAHGSPAVQAGVVEAVVSVHLIEGMAALMQHGIDRGQHRVFMIMRGNAQIPVVKTAGKGMLGCAEDTAFGVEPFQLHQGMGKLLLPVSRIVEKRKRLMRPLHLADFFDQRDDPLPDRCEEFIAGRHGQAFFKTVEEDIVRLFFRIPKFRHAAVCGNELLQIRGEEGKIIAVFCPDPDRRCLTCEHGILHVFLCRDFDDFSRLPPENLTLTPDLFVQLIAVLFQLIQQPLCFRCGSELIFHLAENAGCPCPAFNGVFRSDSDPVTVQKPAGMRQCGLFRFQFTQLFDRCFLFKCHFSFPFRYMVGVL